MFVLIVTLPDNQIIRIQRDDRQALIRIRDNWIADSQKADEAVPTFALGEYE